MFKVRSRIHACHVGIGYPVDRFGNWAVCWKPGCWTYPHESEIIRV